MSEDVKKDIEERKGDIVQCSFCNKYQRDVRVIIKGLTGFICDECLRLSNEMVSDLYPRFSPLQQVNISGYRVLDVEDAGGGCRLRSLTRSYEQEEAIEICHITKNACKGILKERPLDCLLLEPSEFMFKLAAMISEVKDNDGRK